MNKNQLAQMELAHVGIRVAISDIKNVDMNYLGDIRILTVTTKDHIYSIKLTLSEHVHHRLYDATLLDATRVHTYR